MLENFKVIFCRVPVLRFARWLVISVNGTHKSDKLPWNDPVEVTVLHFLIVFILSGVKILEAIPSKLCCDL
jgi:hypothetical protein